MRGVDKRRVLASAKQSRLQLLVRGEPGQIHRSSRVGLRMVPTGDQTAVISPVETDPGQRFSRVGTASALSG